MEKLPGRLRAGRCAAGEGIVREVRKQEGGGCKDARAGKCKGARARRRPAGALGPALRPSLYRALRAQGPHHAALRHAKRPQGSWRAANCPARTFQSATHLLCGIAALGGGVLHVALCQRAERVWRVPKTGWIGAQGAPAVCVSDLRRGAIQNHIFVQK